MHRSPRRLFPIYLHTPLFQGTSLISTRHLHIQVRQSPLPSLCRHRQATHLPIPFETRKSTLPISEVLQASHCPCRDSPLHCQNSAAPSFVPIALSTTYFPQNPTTSGDPISLNAISLHLPSRLCFLQEPTPKHIFFPTSIRLNPRPEHAVRKLTAIFIPFPFSRFLLLHTSTSHPPSPSAPCFESRVFYFSLDSQSRTHLHLKFAANSTNLIAKYQFRHSSHHG